MPGRLVWSGRATLSRVKSQCGQSRECAAEGSGGESQLRLVASPPWAPPGAASTFHAARARRAGARTVVRASEPCWPSRELTYGSVHAAFTQRKTPESRWRAAECAAIDYSAAAHRAPRRAVKAARRANSRSRAQGGWRAQPIV
jgi:hypothetical protein